MWGGPLATLCYFARTHRQLSANCSLDLADFDVRGPWLKKSKQGYAGLIVGQGMPFEEATCYFLLGTGVDGQIYRAGVFSHFVKNCLSCGRMSGLLVATLGEIQKTYQFAQLIPVGDKVIAHYDWH